MSVEDLIAELQKMPPLYEVKAFQEGIEIADLFADVEGIQLDVVGKEVWLEVGYFDY